MITNSFKVRLGGFVGALAVKYIGKLNTKIADQETRYDPSSLQDCD
jgi:hypothetical protein